MLFVAGDRFLLSPVGCTHGWPRFAPQGIDIVILQSPRAPCAGLSLPALARCKS